MRVKICGITQLEQAKAIASLGATALGFICVPASPRYVTPAQIGAIVPKIPFSLHHIGVFVNTKREKIYNIVITAGLTGVQLHGDESPEFCNQLRQALPKIEIIKALRVGNLQALAQAADYANCVDTLLLDAYHPQLMGGTGKTLDWENLRQFQPSCPWFLAGGLTPDNILAALNQVRPDGIDLSSGVESAPGEKDLVKVAQLFDNLRSRSVLTVPLNSGS